MPQARGPLDGITVVDLTSYIAGSYAAMMVGDLGARVIKVEALEGDAFRELHGFYGWNRGKHSIAVNLKDPAGRAVIHRLSETADVVMENMRPGVGEWFFLACGNQSFWGKLCKVLGKPEWAGDPRFASWFGRRDNSDALTPLMEEAFASRPRDEWVRILTESDIPCAPTQPLQAFMSHPAVLRHNMVVEYEHAELGRLKMMGLPLRFSETPGVDPGPPPLLGQHTAEVLRGAGYRGGDIADLHRRGVTAGKAL